MDSFAGAPEKKCFCKNQESYKKNGGIVVYRVKLSVKFATVFVGVWMRIG